jgi:hypothetical protein
MLRLLLVHELIGEKLESQSLGKDGLHILADRWMFSRAFRVLIVVLKCHKLGCLLGFVFRTPLNSHHYS